MTAVRMPPPVVSQNPPPVSTPPTGYGDVPALEIADLRTGQALALTGSWAVDLATGHRYRSAEYLRLFAIPAASADDVALPLLRISPDERERVSAAVQALLEHHTELDETYWIETPDGIRRVIHARGRVEPASELAGPRAVGTVQDVTESVLLRQRLTEVTAALDAVLANSPTAIFLKAPDHRFLLANEETARILGRSPGEVIGRTLAEMLPGAVAAELDRNDLAVASRDETVTIEETAPHAGDGGREHTWLASKFPVRDPDGALIGIGGVSLDITERKASDRARRAADERFRTLIEAAPDGLVIVDDAGTIVLVNRRIAEIFGYAPEELVGRPVDVLLPVNRRAGHRHHLAGFLADPHQRMMGEGRDLSAVRRDGSVFPVEISLSPVPTDEGMLVAAAVRDVTSRRRAESEIARLATIVAASHDAILSKTLEGTIVSWNPAAAAMYGYTPEEAIGQPVAMLLTDPADGREIDDMLARVRAGEVIDKFETQRRTKRGEVIDVELVISPIRDPDGEIVGACTVAREVTERKRVEAQLQFLASHDPLTGLFNRRRFESELARLVEESARYDRPGALLIVDLDGFKQVNDRFGHAAGDTLVRVISQRMQATIRQTDVIARIGGDEFAIILQQCATPDALAIAEKLLGAVGHSPVGVDGRHQATVTASIGIRSFGPGEPTDPDELTVEADRAMYRAKATGKNRCVLVDDSDRRPIRSSSGLPEPATSARLG